MLRTARGVAALYTARAFDPWQNFPNPRVSFLNATPGARVNLEQSWLLAQPEKHTQLRAWQLKCSHRVAVPTPAVSRVSAVLCELLRGWKGRVILTMLRPRQADGVILLFLTNASSSMGQGCLNG